MIVRDHVETPSAIRLKRPSAIAEIRAKALPKKCECRTASSTGGIVLRNRALGRSFPISSMTDPMGLDEFRAADRAARVATPKLFILAPPDRPATERELEQAEQAISAELPDSYRAFLREFGGGSYGLITVFSADPTSEWFLGARVMQARAYLPTHLLPFSDDFAGGLYVFEIAEGQASEAVWYWNGDGGLTRTEFSDVLQFIARYAYQPA